MSILFPVNLLIGFGLILENHWITSQRKSKMAQILAVLHSFSYENSKPFWVQFIEIIFIMKKKTSRSILRLLLHTYYLCLTIHSRDLLNMQGRHWTKGISQCNFLVLEKKREKEERGEGGKGESLKRRERGEEVEEAQRDKSSDFAQSKQRANSNT